MKINRKTVMLWINNYNNNYNNNQNVNRKVGSGRLRKTDKEQDNNIIDIINDDNDKSLIDIKNSLNEKNINLSLSTIYRCLIENNFIYKFPITKPLLTDNHKKNWNGLKNIII